MTNNKNSHMRTIIAVALIITALLSGCKPGVTATPELPTITPTSTVIPAEIVLVDASGAAANDLTTVISQFASENSLQIRTLSAMTSADITTGTKIVVFTADPGNITDLSAAAPSTQFVVLGSSSVTAGGNVSTIKADPAAKAFMAGYLTMLLAYDWRAAGLLTSDGPLGDSYTDAFVNGARYVCGKCNAYFAPLVSFPAIAAEPAASSEATWAADAVALGKDWLSAVFIDPAAANVPVANGVSAFPLNFESVIFVGYAEVSPDSGLTWDALLGEDTTSSLKALLPQLLAGQGGQAISATIVLTQVNEAVVSPARQELFNETAAKVASGELETLPIP
jgi:basic membrane lipoprotein Med (substrate-binding protein (PBP1-ABC) superfamily)